MLSCNGCKYEDKSFNQSPCNTCDDEYDEYVPSKRDSDPTNPPHYTSGGIETIDYLKAKSTPEEFRGFLKGNALKYISRAGKKDDTAQDIEKAIWYLNRWKGEL